MESRAIEVDKLPIGAFMHCIMVQNIAKMQILSKEARKNFKPGSPDVLVSCIGQKPFLASRNDIIDKCKTITGGKIVMGGLKIGQDYTIVFPTRMNAACMVIPNGKHSEYYKLTAKGKTRLLKSGAIVVYPIKAGDLDKNNPMVISKSTFDKMFIIAEKNKKEYMQRVRMALKKDAEKRELQDKANNKALTSTQRVQAQRKVEAMNNKVVAPYKIVGKLVKNGTVDTILGYAVTDGKVVKALSTKQVMQLASQKKINNAVLVKNTNGNYFLRGVGTVLDALPVKYC